MDIAKRISADVVSRVASMSAKKHKKVVWHTANIRVAYSLGAKEFMDVYASIIRDCTTRDGECMLPLIDFSVRVNIIVAFSDVSLPDDMERLFDVIYGSDLYETVVRNANRAQIDALSRAVWQSFGGELQYDR